MSIEVMKQALEAVESWQKTCLDFGRASDELGRATKAITALRQAIEEEEKREWVGLTDEEFVEVATETGEQSEKMSELEITVALWKAIESKLREKNT